MAAAAAASTTDDAIQPPTLPPIIELLHGAAAAATAAASRRAGPSSSSGTDATTAWACAVGEALAARRLPHLLASVATGSGGAPTLAAALLTRPTPAGGSWIPHVMATSGAAQPGALATVAAAIWFGALLAANAPGAGYGGGEGDGGLATTLANLDVYLTDVAAASDALPTDGSREGAATPADIARLLHLPGAMPRRRPTLAAALAAAAAADASPRPLLSDATCLACVRAATLLVAAAAFATAATPVEQQPILCGVCGVLRLPVSAVAPNATGGGGVADEEEEVIMTRACVAAAMLPDCTTVPPVIIDVAMQRQPSNAMAARVVRPALTAHLARLATSNPIASCAAIVSMERQVVDRMAAGKPAADVDVAWLVEAVAPLVVHASLPVAAAAACAAAAAGATQPAGLAPDDAARIADDANSLACRLAAAAEPPSSHAIAFAALWATLPPGILPPPSPPAASALAAVLRAAALTPPLPAPFLAWLLSQRSAPPPPSLPTAIILPVLAHAVANASGDNQTAAAVSALFRTIGTSARCESAQLAAAFKCGDAALASVGGHLVEYQRAHAGDLEGQVTEAAAAAAAAYSAAVTTALAAGIPRSALTAALRSAAVLLESMAPPAAADVAAAIVAALVRHSIAVGPVVLQSTRLLARHALARGATDATVLPLYTTLATFLAPAPGPIAPTTARDRSVSGALAGVLSLAQRCDALLPALQAATAALASATLHASQTTASAGPALAGAARLVITAGAAAAATLPLRLALLRLTAAAIATLQAGAPSPSSLPLTPTAAALCLATLLGIAADGAAAATSSEDDDGVTSSDAASSNDDSDASMSSSSSDDNSSEDGSYRRRRRRRPSGRTRAAARDDDSNDDSVARDGGDAHRALWRVLCSSGGSAQRDAVLRSAVAATLARLAALLPACLHPATPPALAPFAPALAALHRRLHQLQLHTAKAPSPAPPAVPSPLSGAKRRRPLLANAVGALASTATSRNAVVARWQREERDGSDYADLEDFIEEE